MAGYRSASGGVFDNFSASAVTAPAVGASYTAGFQSGVVHLAMTMARAVVTSDVGELGRTVRDGETGILVPTDDPAALAAAIARVLEDPGLRARLGAAAVRMAADAAMAVVDVVRSKELGRLRICEYPGCGGVVVDLSKNRSKRFCDARCSNRAAVAAYRARHAAAAHVPSMRRHRPR